MSPSSSSTPSKSWRLVGIGRTRCAWSNGWGLVIKVPMGPLGVTDNIAEATIYQNKALLSKVPLARCQLLPNNHLLMEEITPVQNLNWRDKPDWLVNMDNCQAGLTKKHLLVAYDYAGLAFTHKTAYTHGYFEPPTAPVDIQFDPPSLIKRRPSMHPKTTDGLSA